MQRTIIIGSRGSELALWQANHVKKKLAAVGVESEIRIIKTQGDNFINVAFNKLIGKGFLTKELEEELLSGAIDLAVHSHKDLPTEQPPGLVIAAVSEREEPVDVLIIHPDGLDITQ
ncbi:MAG TPA: hydroxymethylbilane synthase, partial [Anseongella sp.]|nr:hydroxymethylbilane synthase [Anseongella sp.]